MSRPKPSNPTSIIFPVGFTLALLIGIAFLANNLAISRANPTDITGNLVVIAKGVLTSAIVKQPPTKSPYTTCQKILDTANKTFTSDTALQKTLKQIKSLSKTPLGNQGEIERLANIANQRGSEIYGSYDLCVLPLSQTKPQTTTPSSPAVTTPVINVQATAPVDLRIINRTTAPYSSCNASLKQAQVALKRPANKALYTAISQWETVYVKALTKWQETNARASKTLADPTLTLWTKYAAKFMEANLRWSLTTSYINMIRTNHPERVSELKDYYDCISAAAKADTKK